MYGAELKLIEGNRAATTQAVLEAAETTYYASHNWNPFFLEGRENDNLGTKTIAFEIAEQLGWETPDHIICPIGFGSVYMGLYIGSQQVRCLHLSFRNCKHRGLLPSSLAYLAFNLLRAAPFIRRIPRIGCRLKGPPV